MDYKTLTLDLIDDKFESSKQELDKHFKYLRKISDTKEKKICLFGAGAAGKDIFNCLFENEINVDYFIDNDKEKYTSEIINRIICIDIEDFEKIKDDSIVIISIGTSNKAIIEQLHSIGVKDKNIITNALETLHVRKNELYIFAKEHIMYNIAKLFDILDDEYSRYIVYKKIFAMLADMKDLINFNYDDIYTMPQYFENVELGDNQVVVDCGAYDGDSLKSFLECYDSSILKEYICYELDIDNFNNLCDYVNNLDIDTANKISPYNSGVDKEYKTIKYAGECDNVHINEYGNTVGNVVSMDTHIGNRNVTFIKMDIEGSEVNALIGAENIIKNNKPICAISNYHKSNHLWLIPFMLKEYNPNYKIHLRHHSNTYTDTVCYAINKEV
jgi:FkbM family methyltransferase